MKIEVYVFNYHTTIFEVIKNGLQFNLSISTDIRDDEPYTNVRNWSNAIFKEEELDALEDLAKATHKTMLLMGGI